VAILFALLMAGPSMVEVESPSGCPSAADVTTAVAQLAENRGSDVASDRVQIATTKEKLVITLLRRNGPTVTRELPLSGSCSDRAWVAANVIANWEWELRPGVTLSPPPAAPPVPVAPVDETPKMGFEVGGGLVTYLAGGVAIGGMVEGAIGRATGGLGARLALAFESSRDQSVAMGTASWRRVQLSAGGRYRVVRGKLCADVAADAVAGFLSIAGAGFATNGSATDFDPGLQAGGRVGWIAGPVEYWLNASVIGWLREERLHVTGLSTVASLPRAEILVGAGVSWRISP
jgi:hypothetical protein